MKQDPLNLKDTKIVIRVNGKRKELLNNNILSGSEWYFPSEKAQSSTFDLITGAKRPISVSDKKTNG